MIREVIVVEGKQDIVAVKKAINAECIATEGFNLPKRVLKLLDTAYLKRGLIILTDPDTAGERIRRTLAKRFPDAKHAFIPLKEAFANDDIGIEQAQPESILKAFEKMHLHSFESANEFTLSDMIENDLTGNRNASYNRAILGEILGIGYANTKTFLYRLNHYGITREIFNNSLKPIKNKGNNI